MLAQYRLNQNFDNKKQLKKCVAIVFSKGKRKEQQDKNFISTRELKLRFGNCDVNTL